MIEFTDQGFTEVSIETIKDVKHLKDLETLACEIGVEHKPIYKPDGLKALRFKENDYLTVNKQFKNEQRKD